MLHLMKIQEDIAIDVICFADFPLSKSKNEANV